MYFLQSSYYQFVHVSLYDIMLVPLIFAAVVWWGYYYASKRKEKEPNYRYLPWALAAKMGAVILFCFAYLIFYEGDTLDYFNSTVALNNVINEHVGDYFTLMFGGNKWEYYCFFTSQTGYPEYHMFKDPQTFFVIRLFSPLVLLSGKSLLISSIYMSLISFIGLWKFYRLLCGLYQGQNKFFLLSALLIPSVAFWGSGLLKDSITMTATVWITYSIFMVFFNKKKIVINVLVIIIMTYLILSIKPYILVSLAPGLLIWLFFQRLQRIRNRLIRMITFPATAVLVLIAASFLFSITGKYLGIYGNVDTMIQKVKITQEDLMRTEAYSSNYYNIGVIEPTPLGLLKKAPAAIIAGLFRPFLWEARNPFIIIAALENLGILLLLVFIFIRVGILNFFRAVIKDPFLTYAMVFALIFAFGVGLASTNFGALVRYRIPLLPFLISGLFIMLGHYRERKKRKEGDKVTREQGDKATG